MSKKSSRRRASSCKCVTVKPVAGRNYRRKLCWAKATAHRYGGIVANRAC
jgi:hypothetical protein